MSIDYPKHTLADIMVNPKTLFPRVADRSGFAYDTCLEYCTSQSDAFDRGMFIPVTFADLMHGITGGLKRKSGETWTEWWGKLRIGLLFCPPVIKDGPQPDTKVFDDETTYPKFFIDNDLPPLGILPMYQPYANRYEGLDGRRPKSSMPKLSDAEKETKFYMIRVFEANDTFHKRKCHVTKRLRCLDEVIQENDSGENFDQFFPRSLPLLQDEKTFGCLKGLCLVDHYFAVWAQLQLAGIELLGGVMLKGHDAWKVVTQFYIHHRWSYQDWLLFISTRFNHRRVIEIQEFLWLGWIKEEQSQAHRWVQIKLFPVQSAADAEYASMPVPRPNLSDTLLAHEASIIEALVTKRKSTDLGGSKKEMIVDCDTEKVKKVEDVDVVAETAEKPSSSKVGEKKERRSGRVSKKARVAYSSDIEELEEQEWQLDVPVKKENESPSSKSASRKPRGGSSKANRRLEENSEGNEEDIVQPVVKSEKKKEASTLKGKKRRAEYSDSEEWEEGELGSVSVVKQKKQTVSKKAAIRST